MKSNVKIERSTSKRDKGTGKGSSEAVKGKRVSKREKKSQSCANMVNGIDSQDNLDYPIEDFLSHYSRASVIRTSSLDDNLYQDQPVDFSAKRKIECEMS